MKNAHSMLEMAALCFSFWIMFFGAGYAKNYVSILYQCGIMDMGERIEVTRAQDTHTARH